MSKFSRQTDIIDPSKLDLPIVVVGCGAVGSWTTLALAKMGCSDITIIDHDIVGEENLGPQVYGPGDIGKNKVDALAEIIEKSIGLKVKKYASKAETILGEIDKVILILALDSLEARKQAIIANKAKPPAFMIDVRMKKELINIFLSFDQKSTENYKKTFDSKIKVDKGKCSEKAVSYNSFVCGGIASNLVKKIANKEKLPYSVLIDLETLSIN